LIDALSLFGDELIAPLRSRMEAVGSPLLLPQLMGSFKREQGVERDENRRLVIGLAIAKPICLLATGPKP